VDADTKQTAVSPQSNFNTLAGGSLPSFTLLEVTGDRKLASIAPADVGLEGRVATAARVPLNELSCEQVRLLVSQKTGLEWLAESVARFCMLYPQAECDIFPGDLTINALLAWECLYKFAPTATTQFIGGDFTWLIDQASEGQDALLEEALRGLEAAKVVVDQGNDRVG